jgi:hypothetical protein
LADAGEKLEVKMKVSVPYIEATLVGLLPFETYVVKELPD